jgi:hypothetical protein
MVPTPATAWANVASAIWRALRLPVIAALGVAAGYWHGHFVGGAEERERVLTTQVEDTRLAVTTHLTDMRRDWLRSKVNLDAAEKLNATSRTLQEEITRYASTHVAVGCLDADGLRIWNAANAGTVAGLAGRSLGTGALPGGAAAGDGRIVDHAAAEPQDGDGHLPGMPAAAQRAGGPGGDAGARAVPAVAESRPASPLE